LGSLVGSAAVRRRSPPVRRRPPLVLAVLLAGKLVEEWAIHVGRLFDGMTFLGVLESLRDAMTAPFRGP